MSQLKPSPLPENENIKIMVCDSMSSQPHTHDFLELAYVTKGSAVHFVGSKKMIISKGDYFIIDYYGVHSYYSMDNKPFQIINCLFRPELIDKSMKYCRSFHTLLNHYLIKMNAANLSINPSNSLFHDFDGKIYNYLKSLLKEYAEKQAGFNEIMRCTLIELIISTMRTIKKTDTDGDNITKFIASYIKENYMKKITLTEIAKELQYSVPYLSNKFKSDFGIGFCDYLEKLRIDEACRLLSNTNRTVGDISESVGYIDTDFFYSVFKKLTGKTPGQFRRMYK